MLSEEEKAKQRARQKRYYDRLMSTEEGRLKLLTKAAALRGKAGHSDAERARDAKRRPKALPFAGSVLAASAVAPGRELLLALTNAVPRFDPDMRSEIIAESALLVCEGLSINDAVRKAVQSINRYASLLKYHKPIEECYWL